MKKIFLLVATAICYCCHAQFPVQLIAAKPWTEVAKIECRASSIFFNEPQGAYFFFPFTRAPHVPNQITLDPSPGTDISFYAEKDRIYTMELNLYAVDYKQNRFEISGPPSFPKTSFQLGKESNYVFAYKGATTGWAKFHINTDDKVTWVFKSCTIQRLENK